MKKYTVYLYANSSKDFLEDLETLKKEGMPVIYKTSKDSISIRIYISDSDVPVPQERYIFELDENLSVLSLDKNKDIYGFTEDLVIEIARNAVGYYNFAVDKHGKRKYYVFRLLSKYHNKVEFDPVVAVFENGDC